MTNKDFEKKRHVIYIDFDRTIHKYEKGWSDGSLYGEPIEGSLEFVQMIIDRGHMPVILTARQNYHLVPGWLKKYGFPDIPVTNIKGNGYIIDDKAQHFNGSWSDTITELNKKGWL